MRGAERVCSGERQLQRDRNLRSRLHVDRARRRGLLLTAERRAGDVEAGSGGQGELELAGGTGVYAGLAGTCAYETSYLPNNQVVTTTDCAWHRE